MNKKSGPTNIIPVIFVSGSNYEMGYQYGYQMAAGIVTVKDRFYGGIKRLIGVNASVWSEMLKGFQYFIKEYTPEIIDEMIGIADGAKAAGFDVTYTDILSINAGVCAKSAMSPTAKMPSPLDELPPMEYQEKYGINADGPIKISKSDTVSLGTVKGPQLLVSRLALRDLFSKACSEFEKGREYMIEARLAGGNQKRYLRGKALTCYTRAESKFREIYNYIHPPAETPEELGLDPITPPRPTIKTFKEKTYRMILEEGI